MAAVLGDLIQCIDNQSYLGQQVLNVYYYRIVATLGIADPYLPLLNDSFETTVLDKVRAIQSQYVQHVSREWKNLSNNVDLFVDGTVVAGTRPASAAEATPSYMSAGFILRRESLVTRNGYKRFAGLADSDIAGNVWSIAGSAIPDVEVALAADLYDGIALLCEPVIVKRPILVPATTYQYASIGSASFRTLGTQNTRKAGRGV